ncbi:MAG TPA: pilus assembly protein PilP [Burkholderiales bacterium]
MAAFSLRSRTPRGTCVVLLLVALAGCSDDGMDDLREFVATAHAGRTPKVEPLPEIKTQEPFQYAAANLPDPFGTGNLAAPAGSGAGSGPRPDLNRRKEPLEEYPLDALKMVGTLSRGRQTWAVLEAPDGTVHRATVGNYLGQNFGKIVRISEDKIDLVELVQGTQGGWVEREASVALADDQ